MATPQHIDNILNCPVTLGEGSKANMHAPRDSFDPQPRPRDDGGVDYLVPGCQQVCYQTDNEGCYVGQCPLLVVSIHGMTCTDNLC